MSNRCNACEVVMINGVRCHEHGCPEAFRDDRRTCKECGQVFTPQARRDTICSEEYYMASLGLDDGTNDPITDEELANDQT